MNTTDVEVGKIVEASEQARDEMYRISAEVDRTADIAPAMELAWQAGIHRLSIPRDLGGLADGSPRFQLEAAAKALLNIAQGEQSCGQMVGTQFLHFRMIFHPDSDVSPEVRQAIAASFAERETRLFGAGNPTGVLSNPGLIATKVPGGIMINGTIAFATQSNGKHGIVGCNAWLPTDDGTDHEMVAGYTMLGEKGVIVHNDWDNMGQRATGSGGMTLEDVFIPDGWWHRYDLLGRGGALAIIGGFPFIAIMLLGMGEAAYRAEVEFIRNKLDRPIWPIFDGPRDDVLIQRRLGKHKTALAAARALVLQAARDAEQADENTDQQALRMQSAAARQVATQAALYVSSDMFELTGARSTAAKYDMDRFWLNARTLGIHDAADVDYTAIGYHEINGSLPPALMERFRRILRKPERAR
jgi:alkylation response protein AidB-like acyl-CoA dehydrogenase